MAKETNKENMKKRGNLFLVLADKKLLEQYTLIFEKYFDVVSVAECSDALQILQNRYNPGVIVADNQMPAISGAEFLEKSITIIPDSVRLLLIAECNPKEKISVVNQAHAFMYLTKPVDDMELIQAVKIAFEHYNLNEIYSISQRKLNHFSEEINKKNNLIRKLFMENKTTARQISESIALFSNSINQFYVNDHIKFVNSLCSVLANELGLTEQEKEELEISANLHNLIYLNLPEDYQYVDPSELNKEKQLNFLNYFNKNLAIIEKVGSLQKYSTIISQIWEHTDGSGFPNSLSGEKIIKTSQIVSIANYYHNLSFGLKKIDSESNNQTTVNHQSLKYDERHNRAVKFLYRKANWFEPDIFRIFHELVKKKDFIKLISDSEFQEKNLNSQKSVEIPQIDNNQKPLQIMISRLKLQMNKFRKVILKKSKFMTSFLVCMQQ